MPRKRKTNEDGLTPHELKDVLAWQRNNMVQLRTGPPEGNSNRLTHGFFSNKVLDTDEMPLYRSIITAFHKDFDFNESSDKLQVELVAIYYVRLGRALAANNMDNAERIDRLIRSHLRGLKTTKLSREGETNNRPETTPAEWATALLERVAQDRSELRGEIVDAEVEEGGPG